MSDWTLLSDLPSEFLCLYQQLPVSGPASSRHFHQSHDLPE
jgi:hypothetical protein